MTEVKQNPCMLAKCPAMNSLHDCVNKKDCPLFPKEEKEKK